jgi:hypothetical protein
VFADLFFYAVGVVSRQKSLNCLNVIRIETGTVHNSPHMWLCYTSLPGRSAYGFVALLSQDITFCRLLFFKSCICSRGRTGVPQNPVYSFKCSTIRNPAVWVNLAASQKSSPKFPCRNRIPHTFRHIIRL